MRAQLIPLVSCTAGEGVGTVNVENCVDPPDSAALVEPGFPMTAQR